MTTPTLEELQKRLRDIAAGARSKASLIASQSPASAYADPVQILRALAKEAEDGLAPDPDAGLEIQRTLMVNTAHLPDLYLDWLQAQNRCNPAFPDIFLPTEIDPEACEEGPYLIVDSIGEYGWRICLTPESTELFLANHQLDDPLAGLLLFAEEHKCDWLGIDRDGPIVPSLPTFEADL